MQNLLASIDRQDVIILAGLILLGAGFALWSAALIVPGGLLFLLGAGMFTPRGGRT